MNRRFSFKIYLLFSVIAAAGLGLYLWKAYQHPLTGALSGTAGDPLTFMSASRAEAAKQYSMFRDWYYFTSYLWEWGMLLWLLLSGAASRWLDRLEQAIPNAVLRFPVFIASLSATLLVLMLPLKITGYVVARSYGVSTLAFPGWVRDQLVGLGVQYVFLLLTAGVAFYLIRRGGRWWFRLWLLSVPFLVFMLYIQPVIIDPLYYKYEPLENARLNSELLGLASQAGISTDRVYVSNVSEKTNAINAYVNGIGPSLRIVLWDTALDKLTDDEIALITAHEIGHYKMRHLEWSAVGSIVSAFFMLWIGSAVYGFAVRRFGRDLHIRTAADWRALPLILLVMSMLAFVSTPAASAVSRQAERAADEYAYQLIGHTDAAVSMYQKLADSALSRLQPPKLVYWFRSTHPSLLERIKRAESQ